jgi:predicted signal transduction protein with EAL and GGDEF domain
MSRITKKQIAAKLGCDETQISQTIDDLVVSLDEELTKRLAAEAQLKEAQEQLRMASIAVSLANSQASQAEAAVKRGAQLLKVAREEAKQASVPGRINTKTRVRK